MENIVLIFYLDLHNRKPIPFQIRYLGLHKLSFSALYQPIN